LSAKASFLAVIALIGGARVPAFTRIVVRIATAALLVLLAAAPAAADPYPPYLGSSAVHYAPVAWPAEPADPRQCGQACGEWLPYTRFQSAVGDPRTQDPSNGGTAPQNYVNIASSCVDKTSPSIYYALRKGPAADGSADVIMFRWRVEQIANTYATGPSAGAYGASDPWNSALWSVLFDVNGDGYIDLAAHLDGSSGAPATAVDRLVGIWSRLPTQSLDYVNDPANVKLLGHNPTAFIDPATSHIVNFQSSLTPSASWPNGSAETRWDYGTTRSQLVTHSPCDEYFIDYQIPVAMLDASAMGGPKITRSTPISMLFCTANSLYNPFQKDCALNRKWIGAAATPGPFGDYVSFDQAAPYAQPIVSSVSATAPSTCPGNYVLSAAVQDTLAVINGAVVPSVKVVRFYYYLDANGNGQADDGGPWTFAADATLKAGTLSTWQAQWDATGLARGQYLIGVQAVDDNTMVDDGVTPSGIDNRTFSYVSGDAQNRIFVGGVAYASVPAHSPAQPASASENWWGNPGVTGNQTALVGVAINACGLAPSLGKAASAGSVAPSATVDFTLTIHNPMADAITVSRIDDVLPDGFTFAGTVGGNFAATAGPAAGTTGALAWTFAPAVSIPAGGDGTLILRTSAPTTSGSYNNTASATTSFGLLASGPAAVTVDTARLSLSKTPGAYAISPDGTTQLVYTLRYANASSVPVANVQLTDVLPAGATFASCAGAPCAAGAGGAVTWTIGALGAGGSGTVSLAITVDAGFAGSSLSNTATVSGTDPAGNAVSASASATVAVTQPGVVAPAFTLAKSAAAAQVAPGASVVFTLTYRNYGGAGANGVTLTDTLPAGFAFASCTGGVTCGSSGGTVTWSVGAVAAGASGSVTVTAVASNPFTAPNPAVNGASLTWTGNPGAPVEATAEVGVSGQACSTYYFRQATATVGSSVGVQHLATQASAAASGNGATTLVNVGNNAGGFVKAVEFYTDPVNPATVTFNGTITSTIYVDRANGPGLQVQTEVFDFDPVTGTLTPIGTASSITMNGSTKGLVVDSSNNRPTFNATGTWQKGHRLLFRYSVRSANTQTFSVDFQYDGSTVANPISGGTTNAPSNGQFCVTPPANLTLAKSVDTPSATAGSTVPVRYTLSFANTGQTKATGTSIVDVAPAGVTLIGATQNGIAVAFTRNGQQYVFGGIHSSSDADGEVAPGATGTLVIDAIIDSAATGTLTNAATIASNETAGVTASASTVLTGASGSGSPVLAIGLSVDRATAQPGDTMTYAVTVVNVGTATASSVQVSEALPLASYYAFGACSAACSASGGTLTWNTGTLAPGASATYTFTMLAGAAGLPAGITVIADQASASAAGVAAVTSDAVNVALNGNPRLAIGAAAAPASGLAPGDTVTWMLTVTNAGNVAADGVKITDPVPAFSAFAGSLGSSAGSATFDAVDNRLVFDAGTLAAGASVTATFTTTVAALPAGTTTLHDTATASAANAAAATASATADASAQPVLSLRKSGPGQVAWPAATLAHAASGTTVPVDDTTRLAVGQYVSIAGQVVAVAGIAGNALVVSVPVTAPAGTPVIATLAYSLTVTNNGNASAPAASIVDVIPPGTSFVSASDGGVDAGGTVTWSIGVLDRGASRTVNLVLLPAQPGTVSNHASATCMGCTTANANVLASAGGLVVHKRTLSPIVRAGDSATYVIDVQNTSAAAIANVAIVDTLPPGFAYASTTSTVNDGAPLVPATLPQSGDIVPQWGSFSIAAGKTLSITFVASVAPTAGAATYQNAAGALPTASTLAYDPLSSTADDVIVLAAGTGLAQGRIYVDNDNDGAYDPAIDTPLAGVKVTIADATTTSYDAISDADGLFRRVVAVGTATVHAQVAPVPMGATLRQGSANDFLLVVPDGGMALRDIAYVTLAAAPDLVLAKSHSGNFAQGQVAASYTLVVSNVGAGSTTGTVSVTDALPAAMIPRALAGAGWTCDESVLTCTRADPLATGASYPPIVLSVDVAANAPASVTNVASVAGGGDANGANNSATDVTLITVAAAPPQLTVTKTHEGTLESGGETTWRLVVANAGGSATSGSVTLVDAPPAALKFTAIAGPGWACVLATLTCTRADALAPGASYPAVLLTARVEAPAGANVTNIARVSGGTSDPNASAAASDTGVVVSAAVEVRPIPALGSPAMAILLLLVAGVAATAGARRRKRRA
jgi:uncharacterized repeat protein (TIGR01451 family)